MRWKHQNFHECCALVKILMFPTHSMLYIWYSHQKSKYPLYIHNIHETTHIVAIGAVAEEIYTSKSSWTSATLFWKYSVALTLKKLRTSKGDYCIKQRFSTITSLCKMGTSLKGKNLLPEGANSFLKEQFLKVWKITLTTLDGPLECYYFYYARAYTA